MDIQHRAPEFGAELVELGIPPVEFGIGMSSGAVVAAHVGSGRRRQYDVVGDTVNLGSRLCGQAGGGAIVLPLAMLERLKSAPEVESMGAVALKGLDASVELVRIRPRPLTGDQPAAATHQL
jgi:class 3 adenylate cyclase